MLNCCHTDRKTLHIRMYSSTSCATADALVAKTIRMDWSVAANLMELYPDMKVRSNEKINKYTSIKYYMVRKKSVC